MPERGSNLLANSRLAVGQAKNAAGRANWIQARITPMDARSSGSGTWAAGVLKDGHHTSLPWSSDTFAAAW